LQAASAELVCSGCVSASSANLVVVSDTQEDGSEHQADDSGDEVGSVFCDAVAISGLCSGSMAAPKGALLG
jgi:hypothetical protein